MLGIERIAGFSRPARIERAVLDSVGGERKTRRTREGKSMTSALTPVDPPELYKSPAFAQGMIAPAARTVYVGGQNGTDASGALVDGLGPQTERALRNVLAVLAAAGTGPENVPKLTIYLDPTVDPMAAYAASAAVWPHRTAVTVLAVAPAREGALVEIEAIAVLP